MKLITGFLLIMFFSLASYATDYKTDLQIDNPTQTIEMFGAINVSPDMDENLEYLDIDFDQRAEQTFEAEKSYQNIYQPILWHENVSIEHTVTNLFYRRGIGKRFIG